MRKYSEGNLAPIVLEFLIDAHTRGRVRKFNPLAPAQIGAFEFLTREGLVSGPPEDCDTTGRGRAYVQALCDLRLPPKSETDVNLERANAAFHGRAIQDGSRILRHPNCARVRSDAESVQVFAKDGRSWHIKGAPSAEAYADEVRRVLHELDEPAGFPPIDRNAIAGRLKFPKSEWSRADVRRFLDDLFAALAARPDPVDELVAKIRAHRKVKGLTVSRREGSEKTLYALTLSGLTAARVERVAETEAARADVLSKLLTDLETLA